MVFQRPLTRAYHVPAPPPAPPPGSIVNRVLRSKQIFIGKILVICDPPDVLNMQLYSLDHRNPLDMGIPTFVQIKLSFKIQIRSSRPGSYTVTKTQ